jgi:type IV secretion system protein VirD4
MKSLKQEQGEGAQLHNWLWSIVIIFILLTCLSASATQYLANQFQFHASLGAPLVAHFYNPYNWINWTIKFAKYYPDFFNSFMVYVTGGIGGVFAIFISLRLIVLRKNKAVEGLHGTAHWATAEEVAKTGLLDSKDGVYVGAFEGKDKTIKYLRHGGPEHVLAFAPTRSGKGVGLVLPTLLSWKHSCLILDIKGENWALTAGWRKNHANNKVMKFDPTCDDGTAVRYNALAEIRLGSGYEVADVQNVATMLIDTNGEGLKDHWAQSGASLLTGVILHTLYKAKKGNLPVPNLTTVYKTINDPDLDIRKFLESMITFKHRPKKTLDGSPSMEDETHDVVATIAREMMNKADNELSGVISTAVTNLSLYIDPLVSMNTEVSDFKIKDLMNDDQPVSLYLVLKPSDKDRLRPLTRLLLNQVLRILIEELGFENGKAIKGYKHRLLLMLDEFTSLGKLAIFQESLAFMAGYGIKSYVIIQDLTQLYGAYTKEESIISNSHIRIAYAPNKVETAELLSKMSGTTTVIKSQRTTSGKRSSIMLGQVSETFQEVSRPLLTVDECMRLAGAKKDGQGNVVSGGDMLIFVAGESPIYGKQILYFKDETFLARSKVPTPLLSDKTQKEEVNIKNVDLPSLQEKWEV